MQLSPSYPKYLLCNRLFLSFLPKTKAQAILLELTLMLMSLLMSCCDYYQRVQALVAQTPRRYGRVQGSSAAQALANKSLVNREAVSIAKRQSSSALYVWNSNLLILEATASHVTPHTFLQSAQVRELSFPHIPIRPFQSSIRATSLPLPLFT